MRNGQAAGLTPETFRRFIQLFHVDGTPNGLRKATIHGWTGLNFVATRTTLAALAARLELGRTEIYILSWPDAEAVVVLGRNCNSVPEWKVKGEKRTYNDVKQARIAADGMNA
ncbi:MAG: hypothetical protein ABIO86_11250 [Sphingomonas sp.]